jgi:hypothetical protein
MSDVWVRADIASAQAHVALWPLARRVTRAGECLLCAEERTFKRKRSGVFRPVNELEVGNVG